MLLPLALSCRDLGLACTQEARAAINVEVRDSVTNAPAVSGAVAVAREGLFADTLIVIGPSMAGAWERAGTYEVTVTKSGYHSWSVTGVLVTADACHVHPVVLQARIKPL